MSPDTRARLGLPALPLEQAASIEAQQRALAGGHYMRWPEHAELLPSFNYTPTVAPLTPLPEVTEYPPESAALHWNLAIAEADRRA
jgi:hypothetical protein